MVTVADIPRKSQRFISRNQLEQIKSRAQRVPMGNIFHGPDGLLTCDLLDEKGKVLRTVPLVQVLYPGANESFAKYKQDVEALIQHVEEADKENDYLLERIRQLESVQAKGD